MLKLWLTLLVAGCCSSALGQSNDDILDILDQVVDAEDKCFPEFPTITKDFLEAIKSSRKLPTEPERDFKCFIHCVGLKLEKINDDHQFHPEGLKDLTIALTGGQMSKEEAHRIVNKCIPQGIPDPCDAVWAYVDCKIVELEPYEFHGKYCQNC